MPTSTNTKPKINPVWTRVCEQASQALVDRTPDVLAAVVATSDGFDVASHIPNDKMSPQQLSAMTSAMLGLAEVLVSEAIRSGSSSRSADTIGRVSGGWRRSRQSAAHTAIHTT